MISQLAVIGVGLIGGSFARALRAAGEVRSVVGCGRDLAHLERARALGVIDELTDQPSQAVRGADVVLLAMPVAATESVLRALSPALDAHTVITDAGSTKGDVVAAAARAWGRVPGNFVPGHPVAGTEHSGVEASFATLFRDRRVILTPLETTDPDALAQVRRLWQATGALVEEMSVERHDRILAAISHLPHVLAYALVDQLAAMDGHADMLSYAAGGFRDFTRIASSSPDMWRDIVLANRDALLPLLDGYRDHLGRLRALIAAGDGEALHASFERAKALRDRYSVPSDEAGASAREGGRT